VTGCGAAWLARLTGGQEVPGSNPGSPTGSPGQRAYFVNRPQWSTRWEQPTPAMNRKRKRTLQLLAEL
jgi:hypothetical protein